MKILMVVSDLYYPNISGGSRRTLETANILHNLGHEIVIYSNKDKGQKSFEMVDGIRVYRKKMIDIGKYIRSCFNFFLKNKKNIYVMDDHSVIKNKLLFKDKIKNIYRHKIPIHKLTKILPALINILKLINIEKFDLIYERSGSYGLGILAAKITKTKSIIDLIDIMYWDWALKNTDKILSYFTTHQVPKFIPRDKIETVFHSVNHYKFHSNFSIDKIQQLKNKLKISDKNIVGLYTGGFYHWHGLKYLIEAIFIFKQRLINSSTCNYLKIILVGKGEMFESIKNLIKEKELENFFILTGEIPFNEIPLYINISNFCISLNTKDPIGLKIFEYMACDKPVIVSKINNIDNYFIDKENIIFVESKNPQDISDKVFYIFTNSEKIFKIGKNARQLVESKYNWEIHGKKIDSIIKKILLNNK